MVVAAVVADRGAVVVHCRPRPRAVGPAAGQQRVAGRRLHGSRLKWGYRLWWLKWNYRLWWLKRYLCC